MKKRAIIFFVACLLLVGTLCSFAEEPPAWLIYERGKESFRNKEYGIALSLFKQAVARKKNYPEAEIAIGDVYAISSEYKLAEEQYVKAYKLKSFFEYPDKSFIALYRLADMYNQAHNERLVESTLLKIIGENKDYNDNVFLKHKDVFYKVFTRDGIDRLLVLYRIQNRQYVVRAHGELQFYYYTHGRFEQSIVQAIFAVLGIVTEAFDEFRNEQPVYKYKSLDSFLKDSLENKNIREYVADKTDLFRILYYLGNASYTLGNLKYANDLWKIVAGNRYSSGYGIKALNQLKKPVIEEYIDVSPKKIEFVWDF